MKKLILLSVMLGSLPLLTQAQDDDMYFVPTKKSAAKAKSSYGMPHDTYYSGSNRSVDEYNRHSNNGSSYQMIVGDSANSDVITFTPVEGVYPDSLSGDSDFQLTRKMARWDGYTPTDAYWEGYDRGRSEEWASNHWHSPWYYSSYYPWYDRWYYDPWYYGSWSWHYGWYDPWYYRPYRYYSWGWGGYYGGYYGTYHHGHSRYRSNSVYSSRSRSNGGYGRISAPRGGNVAGSRSSSYGNRSYNDRGRVVGNRTSGGRISSPSRNSSSNSRSYSGGNSYSSGSSVAGNRTSGSYSGGSSGSFGGNRSSGSSAGRSSGGSVSGSRGGGRR